MENISESNQTPDSPGKTNVISTVLIVGIGAIIIFYLLAYYGVGSGGFALFLFFGVPLVVLFLYVTKKAVAHGMGTLTKVLWIFGFGVGIGGIIGAIFYFAVELVLFPALRNFPGNAQDIFDLATILLCLSVGGYIAYRWGSRRNYRLFW